MSQRDDFGPVDAARIKLLEGAVRLAKKNLAEWERTLAKAKRLYKPAETPAAKESPNEPR